MTVVNRTVIYIPDSQVKALRDAGVLNFSEFVRKKVDEYIAAREADLRQYDPNAATAHTPKEAAK